MVHTLRASVQDHLRYEAEEEELEDIEREVEGSPIMSILQHLKTISFELDIAIEKQCLESVNWYLVPPFVPLLVRFLEEVQIGFDWSAREFNFLVLAGCEAGGEIPEAGY